MYLLPSPTLHHPEICVIGDVQLDPLVALAPGVVLHAEPGSQIHIAAGVCIGMGSVLHVRQGLLTIEMGANLATGVLVIGAGQICQNACVGSGATLINPQVAAGEIIPPASLVGDQSRQVPLTDLPLEPNRPPAYHQPEHKKPERNGAANPYPDPWQQPGPMSEPISDHISEPVPAPTFTVISVTSEITTVTTETPAISQIPPSSPEMGTQGNAAAHQETNQLASKPNRPIYGQDYVKQMMGKMFPNHPG